MSSFPEYYTKFEKMQKFIIDDLKNATIKGHANFLVAMALFNYIEILGSFYYPHDIKNIEIKRFNFVFMNLLPKNYKKVFENIRDRIAKPYNILRCGMTHGYLPTTFINNNQNIKISYDILGIKNKTEYEKCIKTVKCGVKLTKKSKNKYLVIIYTPRFIFDLLSAFEKLKKNINNEDDFKARFIMRASDINLDELE